MTRTLREQTKSECPRHRQHLVRVETVVEKQARETRRLDAHRWWSDLVKIFRDLNKSSHMYRFQALRTDPRTGKFLFPIHLLVVTCTETLRVISEAKSLESNEGKVVKKRRRKKFSKRRYIYRKNTLFDKNTNDNIFITDLNQNSKSKK